MSWIEKQVYGKNIIYFILSILIIKFCYVEFMTTFVLSDWQEVFVTFQFPGFMRIYTLFSNAFWEEWWFRFIPLIMAVIFLKKSTRVWVVIIMVSIIFGVLHGGLNRIFIQGVSGVMCSIVFFEMRGIPGELFLGNYFINDTSFFI